MALCVRACTLSPLLSRKAPAISASSRRTAQLASRARSDLSHVSRTSRIAEAADRRRTPRGARVIVAAAEEVHSAAEGVRPFNGPVAASGRDSTAYGSERPGMNNEWDTFNGIPDTAVEEWLAHMKGNGISRVISLLNAKELTFYTTPLEEFYHHSFKSFKELNMKKEGALKRAMEFLDDAAANDEKVVIHCSGGQGRTGIILAAWLVHKYGLSPEEAVAEMVAYAKDNNASRNDVSDKLPGFLEKGYLE